MSFPLAVALIFIGVAVLGWFLGSFAPWFDRDVPMDDEE